MQILTKLLILLVIILCAAMLFAATEYYPAKHAAQSVVLPMTFAHADHRRQQCVTCHHNYQDDTGHGLCIDCHRSDPEISSLLREQFHELCMGCHTDTRLKSEHSGPLRSCAHCHTEDNRP